MTGHSAPSTFVPPYRAGIRDERRIPISIPGFAAGRHDPATYEPDPAVNPWYRAGLRGAWWKRAVGRGK